MKKKKTKQQPSGQNWTEQFRNRNLSYKISIATAILLVISLTIMIAISAILTATSLNKTVVGEFDGIATQNGLSVQNVIDTADHAATLLQNYIEGQYDEFSQTGYSGVTEKSAVYDVNLQEMNKQIEDVLLTVARSTVTSSEGIAGVGVFFEPNAFDPSIKDYTVYVSEDDAKSGNVQSYGAYEDYGSQDYYKNAAESQTNCFTDPYEDQEIHMVSASFPIVYDNETMGVILVDINLDTFDSLRTSDSKYPSMYVDVLNPNGIMIYDSESTDYIGKSLQDLISPKEYAKIQAGIDSGESFHVSTKKDDGSSVVRFYAPIDAAGQTWWAASALTKWDLNKSTVFLVVLMVVIALVSLIAIIVISSRLLRRYIKPINNVVAVANQLSQGDFNVSIQAEYHDEIGDLAETFSSMAAQLRSIIADIAAGLKEMADGNFNISSNVEHVGEFKDIETALEKVVHDLSHTLHEINEVSELVSANAGQIADGAQALTEGATDQASSIDELQSTIATVSEQVERNADNANEANEKAKIVGDDIMASNTQMQKVVEAMETINENSVQISTIINTINDIAEQTNLLALNASIEAARAGEAGKGFAVVATQVGALAAQSAEAAKNSNDLIAKAIAAVNDGKQVVDDTASKLLTSVDKTNDLVSNIGEISEASEHQSEALKQISQAADQIAAVIQENTAMAEESSASSEELAAQAEKLKELISVFQLLQE